MKKKPLSYYKKKCDKRIQEIGREVYKTCMVCGKPQQVLHHYYPRSLSASLRYDWDNLIPLCNGCHFSHHNGNPEIHETVLKKKGEEWANKLKIKKQKKVKYSKGYYENVLILLDSITKLDKST